MKKYSNESVVGIFVVIGIILIGYMTVKLGDVDLLGGDEKDQVREEVAKLNPRRTYPTLVIDDTVIVGYDEDRMREVLDS